MMDYQHFLRVFFRANSKDRPDVENDPSGDLNSLFHVGADI